MADSEGFEPSIPDKGYASLAGRWFQPTHPTVHMCKRASVRLRWVFYKQTAALSTTKTFYCTIIFYLR